MVVTEKISRYFNINSQYGALHPYSVPVVIPPAKYHWANPHKQFTVTYDKNAKEISGNFYDWCNKENAWIDVQEMTDEEILTCLKNGDFKILV